MYHPDHALQIAHTRERELLNEAEICGLSRADGDGSSLLRPTLVVAFGIAAAGAWLRLFIW